MSKRKNASISNSKLQLSGSKPSISVACPDLVPHQAQSQINPQENNIKIGDFVEFGVGVAEIINIRDGQAELLISSDSSIWSVWRDLDSLQVVPKVEDQYGTWWQIGTNCNSSQTPIWHNPKLEVIECEYGEKYIVLERSQSTALVVREGLRPKRDGSELEGWKIGCINPWHLELPIDEVASTIKAKGTKAVQPKTEELCITPSGTQYIQLTLWDWLAVNETSHE